MKMDTDEGEMEMPVKLSVDYEETYDGTVCWLLSMTTTIDETRSVVTWWMSKAALKLVHGRIQMYVDDNLVFEQEFDPTQAPQQAGEAPEPVDVQYVVGQETITVAAGTFVNCWKAEVKTDDTVTNSWVHPDVPIWGMVKTEMYQDGELSMTMELTSYGG